MSSSSLKKIKRMYEQGSITIDPCDGSFKLTHTSSHRDKYNGKFFDLYCSIGLSVSCEVASEEQCVVASFVIPSKWLNADRREAIRKLITVPAEECNCLDIPLEGCCDPQ